MDVSRWQASVLLFSHSQVVRRNCICASILCFDESREASRVQEVQAVHSRRDTIVAGIRSERFEEDCRGKWTIIVRDVTELAVFVQTCYENCIENM